MKRYIKSDAKINKIQQQYKRDIGEEYIYEGGIVPVQDRLSIRNVIVTSDVDEISREAFNRCSNLIRVDFEGTITAIRGGAFSKCTSLNDITLPNGLEKIGARAFLDCTNLYRIEIPISVTFIDDTAFDGCENITLVINSKYAKDYCEENWIPYIEIKSSLIEYAEAESDTFE